MSLPCLLKAIQDADPLEDPSLCTWPSDWTENKCVVRRDQETHAAEISRDIVIPRDYPATDGTPTFICGILVEFILVESQCRKRCNWPAKGDLSGLYGTEWVEIGN